MNELTTTVYTDSAELPPLDERNYFHSRRLFDLYRQTPRHKPYMAVCTDAEGRVQGHLLAIVRYRASWLPPYLYSHCRILGEGVYYDANTQRYYPTVMIHTTLLGDEDFPLNTVLDILGVDIPDILKTAAEINA